MSNYTDDIEYSLAKRVPNMERGFAIETDYGRILIEADQAPKIIKAVRAALNADLVEARKCPGNSQPRPGVVKHRCV